MASKRSGDGLGVFPKEAADNAETDLENVVDAEVDPEVFRLPPRKAAQRILSALFQQVKVEGNPRHTSKARGRYLKEMAKALTEAVERV